MGDLLDPTAFNKPRYRHEVLIGNWYEDRALRDPNFLTNTATYRKSVTVDSVVKDEVRPTSATLNGGVTVNGGQQNKEAFNKSSESAKDVTVNPGDPIRGYYATTYKRSYGPRNGYIHYETYPPAIADFDQRREAALHPDQKELTLQETTMNNNNNCLRCEQLAKTSNENSDCPRCVQLAGL